MVQLTQCTEDCSRATDRVKWKLRTLHSARTLQCTLHTMDQSAVEATDRKIGAKRGNSAEGEAGPYLLAQTHVVGYGPWIDNKL